MNNILTRNKDFLPLKIQTFPWCYWLFGLMILILTLLMVYNVFLDKNSSKRFFLGFDGT